MKLIVGNKNYSSWSLRGYLPLRFCQEDFEIEVIPLRQPGYKEKILQYNANGLVPILLDQQRTITDSLAIAFYLKEKFQQLAWLPEKEDFKALALSYIFEMHAGFLTLRQYLPMDIRSKKTVTVPEAHRAELAKDIARVQDIWLTCLRASRGPFLLGEYGLVDMVYAPVVSRFLTYGVEVNQQISEYMTEVWAHEHMATWCEAAASEPWVIE